MQVLLSRPPLKMTTALSDIAYPPLKLRADPDPRCICASAGLSEYPSVRSEATSRPVDRGEANSTRG